MPRDVLKDLLEKGGLARGIDLIQKGYRGNAVYQALRNIFPNAWFKSVKALGARVFGAVQQGKALVRGEVLQVRDLPVDPGRPGVAQVGLGTGPLEATVRYSYRDPVSHRRKYRTTKAYGRNMEELTANIDRVPDYIKSRVLMHLGGTSDRNVKATTVIRIEQVTLTRRR